MSAHPLASYISMRQRPDAGPVLPPKKPRSNRRRGFRLGLHLRIPRRAPAAESPSAPVVLTPANLRPHQG